jgi:hypothetical protein
LKYAATHDGVLPKAETWQTDTRPYLAEFLKPPGVGGRVMDPRGDRGCDLSDHKTMSGMAFNSEMSGENIGAIIGADRLDPIGRPT